VEVEFPVVKSPEAPTQSVDGPAGTLGVVMSSAVAMLTVKHPDHADTTAVCDSQRDRTRTQ
jgi:hypothetical protein